MIAENVKEKEAKIGFLQKAIDEKEGIGQFDAIPQDLQRPQLDLGQCLGGTAPPISELRLLGTRAAVSPVEIQLLD